MWQHIMDPDSASKTTESCVSKLLVRCSTSLSKPMIVFFIGNSSLRFFDGLDAWSGHQASRFGGAQVVVQPGNHNRTTTFRPQTGHLEHVFAPEA